MTPFVEPDADNVRELMSDLQTRMRQKLSDDHIVEYRVPWTEDGKICASAIVSVGFSPHHNLNAKKIRGTAVLLFDRRYQSSNTGAQRVPGSVVRRFYIKGTTDHAVSGGRASRLDRPQ